MKSLDIDPSAFLVEGGEWTAREIAHQPAVWEEALAQAASGAVAAWIADALADPRTRVVFTGAGTSAYIGDSLVPVVSRRWAYWLIRHMATGRLGRARHRNVNRKPSTVYRRRKSSSTARRFSRPWWRRPRPTVISTSANAS